MHTACRVRPPLSMYVNHLTVLLCALQVCFHATRSLKTEELHRCVYARSGVGYIVDTTVRGTAPYGDYWRTVCRFTCAAHAAPGAASSAAPMVGGAHARSQLRISWRMAYAKPVSGWMRRVIEPAAESGLAKNFAQFIEALSKFTALADAQQALTLPGADDGIAPAQAASATERIAPTEADAAAASSRVDVLLTALGGRKRMRTFRTVFVDDHLLDLFLPAANVLVTAVGAAAPASQAPGVRAVAAVLSTVLVAVLLQAMLSAWHFAGSACGRRDNIAAHACHSFYRAVDLPRSVTGLVMAIGIIMLVRSSLGGWAKVRMRYCSNQWLMTCVCRECCQFVGSRSMSRFLKNADQCGSCIHICSRYWACRACLTASLAHRQSQTKRPHRRRRNSPMLPPKQRRRLTAQTRLAATERVNTQLLQRSQMFTCSACEQLASSSKTCCHRSKHLPKRQRRRQRLHFHIRTLLLFPKQA